MEYINKTWLQKFKDKKSINEIHNKFNESKPFPYIILDNFLSEELANQIAINFPQKDDNFWFEYNNPLEKKFGSDDIRKYPLSIAKTIHFLNSETFLKYVEKITGIKTLESDPYLHGGGLHCTKSGGKLDIHLDYSLHPKLGLERCLNLIIYLTPNWSDEYGGNLEFWNEDVSECIQKISVKFNRAVLFSTGDISYHGHPDPTTSPDNITRNSIALYYLTKPRANCPIRPRALYVARPQDSKSEEIERFRKNRSEVLGVYSL